MRVDLSELPRKNGFPSGNYRFRSAGLNTKVPGATFVNGVCQQPVTGRVLVRLRGAYGSRSIIEPWDDDTALAVLTFVGERDRTARLAQLEAELELHGGPLEPLEGESSPALKPEPAKKRKPRKKKAPAAPESAAQGEPEDAVPSAEPIIDDDIDTQPADVLVAIASGMGLETEDVPLPQLRLSIRKARGQ